MSAKLMPELEPAPWLRGWALAGAVLALADVVGLVVAVVVL